MAATQSVSLSPAQPLCIHHGVNRQFLFLQNAPCRLQTRANLSSSSSLAYFNPLRVKLSSSSSLAFNFNPLRFSVKEMKTNKKSRGSGAVCSVAIMSPHNLQWISAISSAALMISKGTAIHKSFLVPLFALQAPANVVSWIKGEYGLWAAFLAILVRLFFPIPGELELPLLALLLVIVAPYGVMNLRGTQQGGIIGLVITGYLAYQHFSRAGSLQNAFDQGSIVATLAIACITVVSFLLLV